jgi:hypothetical protein
MLEPLVAWPKEAEPGKKYLITIDLRAEDGPSKSYDFSFMVDGSEVGYGVYLLDSPTVTLNPDGQTNGPARYLFEPKGSPREAKIWVSLLNQYGVPQRTFPLPVKIIAPTDNHLGDG